MKINIKLLLTLSFVMTTFGSYLKSADASATVRPTIEFVLKRMQEMARAANHKNPPLEDRIAAREALFTIVPQFAALAEQANPEGSGFYLDQAKRAEEIATRKSGRWQIVKIAKGIRAHIQRNRVRAIAAAARKHLQQ